LGLGSFLHRLRINVADPKSGNTYDCYAWMESNDLLKLKGFVAGIRWLGRSSEWYRT